MNKLLLFATSLVCLSLEGFGFPQIGGSFNDSIIKAQTVNDPKNGFKDLFDTESSSATVHLNPKAISFVEDYMDEEGKRLEKMKSWGKPFFDKIDAIFIARGIPVELKYLAVIESDLKTSATSRVGAAGPWQFMPQTAKDLGLKVTRSVDERRNFTRSTQAAAKYLKSLYKVYGDWLLVLAAYNGGPGKVNTAIRRSGSSNFWELQNFLPAESRKHVKKFIATHYIMEGEAGLTTLTKHETEAWKQQNNIATTVVDASLPVLSITGKYNSMALTAAIDMNITEFNSMNPDFDRQLSANGKYELRLPQDKMDLFKTSKPQILEHSIRLMVSTATR
ncbi:MAG: lytic transglycosylase domain-containing protein [Flavisolibacter sp.]